MLAKCSAPAAVGVWRVAEKWTPWKDAAIRNGAMKFGVIADVHANLEAFQAVLGDAKEQGCTYHAFLGEVVGYCAGNSFEDID